jgi:hypothetical protein
MTCKDFTHKSPHHEIPNFRFQLFVIKELLFLTTRKGSLCKAKPFFMKDIPMTEAFGAMFLVLIVYIS